LSNRNIIQILHNFSTTEEVILQIKKSFALTLFTPMSTIY